MTQSVSYAIPSPVWKVGGSVNSRFTFKDAGLIRRKGAKPYLAATDGKCAVIVPCGDAACSDTMPDAVIPASVLKVAKPAAKGASPVFRVENGRAVALSKSGTVSEAMPEGAFPPVRDVVPLVEGGQVFSFNAALLAKMATAMGSETVTIIIRGQTKPIAVLPGHDGAEGAYGVLMPCSPPEDAIGEYARRSENR